MSDKAEERMVWIDLEMTGLDLEKESIIEIATLVTDGDLKVLAEGPNLAITVDESLLSGMDEWNTTHHHASGLVERIRTEGVPLKQAEEATLAFLQEHVKPGVAPLCGNSVWNDKRFLEKEMPRIAAFLHYRMIDVSTVKELARRWYPEEPMFPKRAAHLALDDIRESVQELSHWRDRIFRERS